LQFPDKLAGSIHGMESGANNSQKGHGANRHKADKLLQASENNRAKGNPAPLKVRGLCLYVVVNFQDTL
jgi:hypothetical protein